MAYNAHFRRLTDFRVECLDCGEHLESGIANIAGHWAECGGKEMVLTARMLIDTMHNISDNNKDLVDTIGGLLELRQRRFTVAGGEQSSVAWEDIEEVLRMFGYGK